MAKISIDKEQLILPIYINEKTVLDMLAILEDGFAMISEVSTSIQDTSSSKKEGSLGVDTKALFNKLLRINVDASMDSQHENNQNQTNKYEKVHTNVSLFSKFRKKLIDYNMLKINNNNEIDIKDLKSGDFIEVEGKLEKNPMIDYLEKFLNVFKLIEIFSEKPQLENENQSKQENDENTELVKQINWLLDDLKVSGTIDFILDAKQCTLVFSAQEKYLENDNISELIGGEFKILGKIIKVCEGDNESINLLRKTTFGLLDQNTLTEVMAAFRSPELQIYNLPEFRAKIKAPAAIIIPIAIYS